MQKKDETSDTSRKVLLRVAILVPLLIIVGVAAFFGFDLFLHRKFDKIASVNYQGYRGPVIGKKQANEIRIIVLGGSVSFGYGLTPEQTVPASLERHLNETQSTKSEGKKYTVFNIAFNGTGAAPFLMDLKHYEYLNYDMVLFYEGIDDLASNKSFGKYESPLFKMTGYFTIIPVILKEKAMAIRYGGDLESAYWGKATVFRPNLTQKTTATALQAVAGMQESIEKNLGKFSTKEEFGHASAPECGPTWSLYCGLIGNAAEFALTKGKKVLVSTEPFYSEAVEEQQAALHSMLQTRFGNHKNFSYANIGKVLAIKDPELFHDGVHLSAKGSDIVAKNLVQPVLSAL